MKFSIKKAMTAFETLIYIFFISIIFLVVAQVFTTSAKLHKYLINTFYFKDDFFSFEKDYIKTVLYNDTLVTYECNNGTIIKRKNGIEQKRWEKINCISLFQDPNGNGLTLTIKRPNGNLVLQYNIK